MTDPQKTTVDSLRAAFASWAQTEPDIEEAWLVGSRAWGSPKPESDWDIYLKMPIEAYVLGTMYSGWDETVNRWTGLNIHLMSAFVKFHQRGKDPERDGILIYRREARMPETGTP